MYTVYILYSFTKDRFYIGHTEDIERRLNEHNVRRNLGAADWLIKYTEQFESRADAMKREKEIKSKKRREYIEKLIRANG